MENEEKHSYIEKGQKYLQCKVCYDYQKVKTGRPPGWHFMSEFVDKDGNVFHKGTEQPELKGTLKPTKVKPIKKKKKLSADEKLYKRITDYKKKQKIKKRQDKKK